MSTVANNQVRTSVHVTFSVRLCAHRNTTGNAAIMIGWITRGRRFLGARPSSSSAAAAPETGAGEAIPASSGPWSDVVSSMSSAPPGTGKDDPETARPTPERDER